MRKKIWKLLLAVSLLASMTMTAYAETSYGKSDWSVRFTNDKKMVSKGIREGQNAWGLWGV